MRLRSREIELYGIDPSPYMLTLAKKKVGDSADNTELSDVYLSLGNSRLIPFHKKFDMIFSSLSFHHWKNREESIPYILTRLNENGEFAIYEYDRDALSFLRRMVAGKHALSTNDVKGLGFDGYKKTIELREPFIIVRFKKTGS
jgi:SAM-dependent methyltransferase